MKRLLTFLYLLLGLMLLDKSMYAQAPATGTPFMNLPDTTCWNSFASTNAFYWGAGNADSATWTIDRTDYTLLYTSDTKHKLVGQLPDVNYHKNSLTIKFTGKGTYTITAKLYKNNVATTVSKTIYVKDCSILPCQGKNTGVGDFKEDFGRFKTGATNSVSNPAVTGYQYKSIPLGGGDFPDDSYTIFWNTHIKNEWENTTDHTGSTKDSVGGMLIANSSTEKKTFFQKKSVPVCPGSSYNFSAWFLNLNGIEVFNSTCAAGNSDGYHYAGVSFLIIDNSNPASPDTLARFKTYDVSMNLSGPQWQMYGGGFQTPGGVTSVTLEIVNDRLGDCGNDIAIDDISFSYCSPYIYSFIDGQVNPPLKKDSLCEGAPVTIKASYSPNGWQSDGTYDKSKDYFKNPVYQWEFSGDGINWTPLADSGTIRTGSHDSILVFKDGALVGDPDKPIDLYYRVGINELGNASNCASPSEYTKITILPRPKVTVSSGRICRGEQVVLQADGGYSTYEWKVDPVVLGPTLTVIPDTTSTYWAIGIADYGLNSVTGLPRQCMDSGQATVIVDTLPKVTITGGPVDLCLGSPIALEIPASNAGFNIVWTPAGTGTPNVVTFEDIPAKLDTNKYYVTVSNGTCVVADTFKVKTFAIPVPKATAPATQCDNGNFNLNAVLQPGETGLWSLVTPDPSITITDPAAATTTITGVPAGTPLQVRWTVTNAANTSCTHDTVIVINNQSAIDGNVVADDQILCKTNDPRSTFTGSTLTGGSGTYTYRWQKSTDGITFTNITGATGPNYTPPAPANSTTVYYYRRTVTSGTCTSLSNVVTLRVNTQPILGSAPVDKIVECVTGSDYTTYFGTPTFTGFNVTVSAPVDNTTNPDACTQLVKRSWTGTDACGKKLTVTQTITVKDTKPPVFSYIPSGDTTVSCGELLVTPDPVAADDCSGVTITSVESTHIPGSCANEYSYTITWTATDVCGNIASTSQLVHVEDKTPPVFTLKPVADTTVDCDAIPKKEDVKYAVTDKCSPAADIVVTYRESDITPTPGCANAFTFIRTWVAEDGCGNKDSIKQIVHVIDSIKPVFTLIPVADTTVDCDKLPKAVDVKYAVTDNCTPTADINVTYSESTHTPTPGCANAFTFIRTWVAEDGCGNKDSIKQTVHIIDSIKPVFTLIPVADITVDCDKVPKAVDVKYAVTDNCTPTAAITVTYSESTHTPTPGCANAFTFIRTWVAEDGCGNKDSIKQTVHVIDSIKPVFTLIPVADTTVDCDKVPKAVDVKYAVTDNCTPTADINVTYSESTHTPTPGCANAYMFIRTWVAEDGCGNKDSVKQTVHVIDSIKPVFTLIPVADTTVDCDKVPKAVDVKYAVTDNCTPTADINVTYSESTHTPTPGCANAYMFIRTWVAEDGCGNKDSIKQTVHVIDSIKPVFTLIPVADTTVDCDKVPKAVDVKYAVTDNCTPTAAITVTYSESTHTPTPGCANAFTFIRTWVAEDGCGNKDSIKQTVHVIDSIKPVFTLIPVADTTVDCDKVPKAVDVKYAVTDNCTPTADINVTYSESTHTPTPGCANAYMFIRTWVAEDGCGNKDSVKQTVHVIDSIKPVFTLIPVADTTVDCDKVPKAVDVKYAVTDNCTATADINVTYSESTHTPTPGCANAFTFIRTWVAEDGCGNKDSVKQTVHVIDSIKPVFTLIPMADTTVDCDKVPKAVDVKYAVTDNCTPTAAINVTYSESTHTPTPGCANAYMFIRTWVAEDGCGNKDSVKQTVHVIDSIKPVFTLIPVADTTVDCDKVPKAVDVKYAVTDNCTATADINVTYSESTHTPAPGCANAFTFIRTWVAEDGCGNKDSVKQTVHVIDSIKPVFTLIPVADTTVDCDKVPKAVDVKYAVTDNCTPTADIKVTYSESTHTPTPGCANAFTFIRTWVAEDGCGNKDSIKQTVHVIDSIKPVFTLIPVADTTVDCDKVPKAVDVKYAVTDNCTPTADINVTYSESTHTPTPGCANAFTFIRTWVAEDGCGNKDSVKQTVHVIDSIKPVFTLIPVADTTVDCDKVPKAVDVKYAVTDNCTPTADIKVTYSESTHTPTPGCANAYMFIRTWVAEDGCGNKDSVKQTVHVIDSIKPVFTLIPVADTTVDCDKVPKAVDVKYAVTDNCTATADIKVTYSESTHTPTPGCANAFTFIRTWVAEDGCGNKDSIKQTVHVIDSIKPVFTLIPVADTTVDCDKVPKAVDVKYAVTDNCTPTADINVTYSESTHTPTPGCANAYMFIRTWVAEDGCGNKDSVKQTVHVIDSIKPVFTLIPVADTTVDCDKVPKAVDVKYAVTDNCTATADINVTYSESTHTPTPGCANAFTFIRTWVAEDGCGNKDSVKQTVHVIDSIRPVFTLIPVADTTVDCDKVPKAVDVKYAVTDNCTPTAAITVTYSESTHTPTPGCANAFTFIRTWVAEDGCGNKDSIKQTVHVIDSIKPVFTLIPVADTTVDCDKVPKAVDVKYAVTDNCTPTADINVTYSESTHTPTPGCANAYMFIRTWVAEDGCGNKDSVKQTVHVIDSIKPVFTLIPVADTTVDCDKVPKAVDVKYAVTDNCTPTAAITVTYSESTHTPTPGCANAFTFIRTWVAEDGCGNKDSVKQTVRVIDSIKPVFTLIPVADTTVDCDAVPKAVDVKYAVTDNCTPTADITVTYSESTHTPTPGCANAYMFIRTWVAEDGCGNKDSVKQTVHVIDSIKPVFTLIPVADTTVDCDKVPKAVDVKYAVTDNCTPTADINVTYSESTHTPTPGCANAYMFIRTWVAEDGCGNKDSVKQTVHVIDSIKPVFTLIPVADTTVDCDKVPKALDVKYAVTDNCTATADINVTYSESTHTPTPGCANAYMFIRTWVAEDGCGNKDSVKQTVHVIDSIKPVFTLIPVADTTVDCDKVPKAVDVKYAVTDNCTPTVDINVTYSESTHTPTPGCANAYTFTRTWVAEDGCGNSSTIKQKVMVIDRTAPVFTLKPTADTIVDCNKVPKAVDVKYAVTDNCTPVGNITVTYSESTHTPTPGCANAFTFIRTWVAEDGCGNKDSVKQTVHVIDSIKPVFTLIPVADTIVDCDAVPKAVDVIYAVTDNCTPTADIKVTYSESTHTPTPGCTNAYMFIRTWVAEDGCGNKNSIKQSVHVIDSIKPVFTFKPAADTTVDCDKVPDPADVKYVVTDNCTPAANIKVTYSETGKVPTAGCANAYTFTRIWVAEDGCGNSATLKQNVTVIDRTAPVFTWKPVADTTVDCNTVPDKASVKFVVTDNCTPSGDIKVTYSETTKVPTPGCANAYTFTRIWVAEDGCGNKATLKQNVNVIDRTAPVFTLKPAADTIVDCDKVPVKDDVKYTVTDNCTPAGNIKVTYSESPKVPTAGCTNAYTFVRTWVATDGCSNSTTIKQTVHVVDRTAPVFTWKPATDTTVDCDKVPDPSQVRFAVTDNCTPTGNIKVAYSESPKVNTPGCANGYTFTRKWVATDGCGNSTTITQNVNVVDRTAPVFTLKPATDTTVDCDKVPAKDDVKYAVTDNCTPVANIKVSYSESPKVNTPGCANAYTFTRTWVATDGCGNTATIKQNVTVIDRTAPVFTWKPAADTTVDCDKVPSKDDVKYAVTDNCTPVSDIQVTYSESPKVPTPGCANAYTFTRTWVAADGCGNTATTKQNVTVIDRTAPVFTFKPATDTTVDCDKVPAGDDVKYIVTDNCTPIDAINVSYSESPKVPTPGCANAYTFTRTWVAADGCGNTATIKQNVTVIDRTAPVFTLKPATDTTVDCDKVPDPSDVKYTVTDNCTPAPDVKVTYSESPKVPTPGCVNGYTFTRTWVATDGCGNATTIKQNVTVVDRTPPVFTVKPVADTTVDCDKVAALDKIPVAATDNCSPAPNGRITFSDAPRVSVPGCANGYTFVRTWTATDDCNNMASLQQRITVQDTTRPVFSMQAPKDTVVDCDKVPAWPVITATDNCSSNIQVITGTKTVKLPGTCAGNYQEIRTWTASDDCGNRSVMQQIITVQDTTKPVFTVKPPADTTVSCDDIPAPAKDVQVTDNCSSIGNGLSVSRRIVTETIPGGCAGNYRIIRTWIAKDACGNTTTMTQVVTVKDTTRPVIMPAPADAVIFCQDKIPSPPVLTATDNCDQSFPKRAIYTEDPFVEDICNGYTIVRRWSIMDACGNKANDVIQRVIIKPCDKPQLEATLPANCSDNGRIALRRIGKVYLPVYTLISVTPSNVVTGLPMSQGNNVFNLNGAIAASFIITDSRTGCSSDTMTYDLAYIQKPMVNLGNDTTICGGNSLVLDAGPANFAYNIKWSTGATTQRINVTKAGTYWVNVSNGQCATTDTIHVGLIPTPLIDIPDTTICRGQSVKLDAYVNDAQYLWSNGATASSILVGTQEQFWVKVMKAGCITIDTVKVSVNPPPDISLSRDTSICPDQSIMLTVNSNGGRIRWQTGETGNSIVVNQPGGYWVAVSRDNCIVRDTVNVRMKPTVTLDLGPDRNICPGGTITLDGTNPDAISYLWNDGDPKPVKQVSQAGRYKLAVMDKYCQRVYIDSVNVNITGLPKINLGRDTTLCKGETLILRAEGGGITGARWDNGSSGPSLTVSNGGTYTVTVFNNCGSATDDITVDVVQCEPKPAVPNAFSPNGDGRNDVFRPVVRGQMFDYELRIFNRWGELIFMTSDDHRGWDGKYKGVPVDIGTYVWWLTYKKITAGPANILKGEVTVVR